MKKTILLTLLTSLITCANAQRHEIYDPNIKSLQVVAGQNWMSLPVIKLRGNSPNDIINIGFDDLTHSYHRYVYKIEHCNADWTVSDQLFTSDYIEGFADGSTIDDNEESINTNVLYTHYKLRIPNEDCQLKMSGNYKLTVYDENDNNRRVFTVCFMVLEPQMGLQLSVTTNTDLDFNKAHQQVSMQLSYGNINVTDPTSQIKTAVMQNGRWYNAKLNAKPQYIMPNGLKWDHNRDLIFPAGNEYHKFEVLDVSHPTMGIDRIDWDGKNYNVYPFMCEPRLNYVYDEDANGAFYIRNSDNIENDISSEYVFVHYRLKCPQKVNGTVYLNATWTNDWFTPDYQMTYNDATQCYEATIMQKQGYYSYQIVMLDNSGTVQIMPTEGSFYQTENKYQALVYYRGQGERTDRLVAYQEVQIK
ncbi:type IX secretion system plug protein [Xylanibacter rarus]|uniref:type IX secretion system plug protein n=1 Tax=Xylanibacter rarus TaxID=1676614 RepID=UPI003FD85425